jgi:segregation and condensation protein A
MSETDPIPTPNVAPADYRVELDVYNGPLDLLLYLIRREEVDIYDIPIARITGQYVAYVELLRRVDPDAVGDFLVMAATLMEIKSRTLLPHAPVVEEEEDFGDPRMELVRQLLEYKRFKDAARNLGLAAELAALKFPRQPVVPASGAGEVDIEDVQLWDLVDAFRRLLEQTGRREATHDVLYDDTPIALHAADVLDSLERAGGVQLFESIFEGRTKSQLIGLFLALLELLRQKRIRAYQETPFGPISLQLLDATPIQVNEERDYSFQEPSEADAIVDPVPEGASSEPPVPVDEGDEVDEFAEFRERLGAADEDLPEFDEPLPEAGEFEDLTIAPAEEESEQ